MNKFEEKVIAGYLIGVCIVCVGILIGALWELISLLL